MTDERHPDETQTDETGGDTPKHQPPAPETEHIKDDGEPLGANLA